MPLLEGSTERNNAWYCCVHVLRETESIIDYDEGKELLSLESPLLNCAIFAIISGSRKPSSAGGCSMK